MNEHDESIYVVTANDEILFAYDSFDDYLDFLKEYDRLKAIKSTLIALCDLLGITCDLK